MNEINKKELIEDSDLNKAVAVISDLKQQLHGIKKTLKLIALLLALFIVGVMTMFLVLILVVYGG